LYFGVSSGSDNKLCACRTCRVNVLVLLLLFIVYFAQINDNELFSAVYKQQRRRSVDVLLNNITFWRPRSASVWWLWYVYSGRLFDKFITKSYSRYASQLVSWLSTPTYTKPNWPASLTGHKQTIWSSVWQKVRKYYFQIKSVRKKNSAPADISKLKRVQSITVISATVTNGLSVSLHVHSIVVINVRKKIKKR